MYVVIFLYNTFVISYNTEMLSCHSPVGFSDRILFMLMIKWINGLKYAFRTVHRWFDRRRLQCCNRSWHGSSSSSPSLFHPDYESAGDTGCETPVQKPSAVCGQYLHCSALVLFPQSYLTALLIAVQVHTVGYIKWALSWNWNMYVVTSSAAMQQYIKQNISVAYDECC